MSLTLGCHGDVLDFGMSRWCPSLWDVLVMSLSLGMSYKSSDVPHFGNVLVMSHLKIFGWRPSPWGFLLCDKTGRLLVPSDRYGEGQG